MSKKIKLELDKAAMDAFFKSSPVEEMIREKTDKVMNQLDPSLYTADVMVRNRPVGLIKPANAHGYYDNLRNNTLLKAREAAR